MIKGFAASRVKHAWAKQHAARTKTNTRKVAPLTNARCLGMILFWLFAICRTIGQTIRKGIASLPWSVFGQSRQNVDLAPTRFAPLSERHHFRRGAFAPAAEDSVRPTILAVRRLVARTHRLNDLSVPAPPGTEARCCALALV